MLYYKVNAYTFFVDASGLQFGIKEALESTVGPNELSLGAQNSLYFEQERVESIKEILKEETGFDWIFDADYLDYDKMNASLGRHLITNVVDFFKMMQSDISALCNDAMSKECFLEKATAHKIYLKWKKPNPKGDDEYKFIGKVKCNYKVIV